MSIKACDWIASYLASIGVEYVHLIFGGGAMVVQDALCKHPKLKYISYHSESGASYAGFGYSKYTNKINIVAPTTGIGSINALPGLISCFGDSTPVLFISGDVNLPQTTYYQKKYKNLNLRQLGAQEVNIIEIVKPITKYAVFLEKAEDICYEIQKCVYECIQNRPGPCWINIPSNILNSLINPEELKQFKVYDGIDEVNKVLNALTFKDLIKDLQTYQRPLILAGGGIRQSNTVKEFNQFIERYQIPFVNTFLANDLVDFNSNLCLGSIGIKGRRNSNFALANCDLLLILGSSLIAPHCGYRPEEFAPKAKKIAIEIDRDIHRKDCVKIDQIINCDLKDFFHYVNQ